MKNNKIYKFDPIIYPYKLWIIITSNIEDIKNVFLNRNKEEIQGNITTKGTTCDVISKNNLSEYGSVIIIKDIKHFTPDLIAHEAYHFVCSLFEYIEEKYPSEEVTAYLLGWAVKCCINIIER